MISPGFVRVQHVGPEAHLLQRAGAKVLDEHVGRGDEPQQRILGGGVAQVEHERALVARVGLPVQREAGVAPVAQRIARRRLDLDHVGAEVGELQRQHVAGDQARQIEHADAVERAARGRVEADGRRIGRHDADVGWAKSRMRCLAAWATAREAILPTRERLARAFGRVEERRVTWGLRPSFRFLSPLIEPDVRVSRIRLSKRLHTKAYGGAPRCRLSLRTSRSSKTCLVENCRDPRERTL